MRNLLAALFLVAFSGCIVVAQQNDNAAPTLHLDVPYVPTPPEVVSEMLRLADVHRGDVLYDLGCGDGRIVVAAAKQYGARAIGIDLNPERIKEAQENARHENVSQQVSFRQQNLFDADFHDANVVTLYLLPSVNLKLRPKLQSELKPGSRIVSHSFDMGDWKPDKTVDVIGRTIYLWIVPERPAPRRN